MTKWFFISLNNLPWINCIHFAIQSWNYMSSLSQVEKSDYDPEKSDGTFSLFGKGFGMNWWRTPSAICA